MGGPLKHLENQKMKKLNGFGWVILAIVIAGLGQMRAAADSIVQITAEVQGLTQASSDQLPPFGTYWLAMPNASFAPLPTPPWDTTLPVYIIANGQYLVDDTEGQLPRGNTITAMEVESNAVVNLINQVETAAVVQPMGMAAAMDSSLPLPGTGSGGDGSGYTNDYILSYSFDTNLLWLQITNVANGTAYANLYNATNQVYVIWSTPDLTIPFANWQVETEVFPTNNTTNCFPFTVATLGRQDLFLRAQDWTGVYSNGLPCWWTWYYFHTLDLSWTNLDAYENTLGDDYTNVSDPNTILFVIAVTNVDVNTAHPLLPLSIMGGIPAYVSILVNDTNLAHGVWQPYTNSDIVAALEGDGDYTVFVGLRGFPTNATATWEVVDLVKNTVPPQLTVTSPAGGTVSQTPIQFQGFANEALNTVTFDLSNANGTVSNQPAFLTGQYYDPTLMAFTTNYFQSDNINLAGGLNIITFHATDWAGNETNFSLALNYPLSAPTLNFIWPLSGTVVASSTFTLQAQVNNPALTISATVGSTTVQGVVEQNGTAWVQNLPLSPGTNNVTVTVSDANGNMSVTNLNVVENNVGLRMDQLEPWDGNLGRPVADVTGKIGNSALAVYVNGAKVVNMAGGTWEAYDVGMNPAGTAVFSVQVSNNTALVASQNFYQAQPPTVALMSYSGHQNVIYDYPLQDAAYTPAPYSDNINWFYQTGGSYVDSDGVGQDIATATNGAGLSNFSGYLFDPPWNTASESLPWEFAALSVLITNELMTYQNYTETRTMIIPSGMQQAGTTNLYLVMARACEFSDASIQGGQAGYGETYLTAAYNDEYNSNGNFPYGGDVGLPPEWLQINGQTLVNTGITNVLSSPDGGPSISSVWGATIIAAPAGQNWPATVVATKVYKNLDYTPAQQITNLVFEIIDANTGTNLSAQTNTVIVGQQMNLTYGFSITNSFMTNFVVTNFQWTVPGFAISNYVVASDSSSAMVVTNFPMNNAAAKFYWVNGASNLVVKCSATANGTPVTGQAVFNVLAPTAKITTSTTSVNIFSRGAWQWILFDGTAGPGITFSNTISIPTNFPSSVVWVQVDYNPTFSLLDTNSILHTNLQEHAGPYVDTSYPYKALSNGNPVDTPGTELPNGNEYVECMDSDTFEMWLMYQPTNGIPVPIRAVNWSWTGSATNYLGLTWMLKQATNSVNPVDFPTSTFPQWNSDVTNDSLVPPVNYN